MDVQDRPSPEEPPKRSRLEDELLEILDRADRPPTVAAQVRARTRDGRGSLDRVASALGGIDVKGPLGTILATLALALVAALVRGVSPLLAVLLGFVAFGLFCSLWFAPGTGPGTGNRWRGRDLNDRPGRPPNPWRRPGPPRSR